MEDRQKLQPTFSAFNNTLENVSCGCVMHRFKGYKTKRRWGQLRLEMGNNNARCILRLFKHNAWSTQENSGKEPKLKFEFQFAKHEFCGIERGDHFNKDGTRRYLCIILKDRHIILEDAVMTAAGINHNILGTWTELISKAMGYVNRWKIIENNPKLANKVCYLHVGTENICECHSLEDKTRDNRLCLVLRSWKSRLVDNVKENVITNENNSFTEITFQSEPEPGSARVGMMVLGSPNLRQIISKIKQSFTQKTICPEYDDLKPSPNLVRIPRQISNKGIKNKISHTLSSKSSNKGNLDMLPASKNEGQRHGNHYIDRSPSNGGYNPHSNGGYNSYYNVTNGDKCIESDMQPHCSHIVDLPPLMGGIGGDLGEIVSPPFNFQDHPLTSRKTPPPGASPRHFTPSPQRRDSLDSLKKGPGLATQISFDSDYQTDDNLTNSDFSGYVNMQTSNPSVGGSLTVGRFQHHSLPRLPSSQAQQNVYRNISADHDQPPAIPARDHAPSAHAPSPYVNLHQSASSLEQAPNLPPPIPPKQRPISMEVPPPIPAPPLPRRPSSENERPRPLDRIELAIQEGTLPPLPTEQQTLQAYENSLNFDSTINEVLQGTHWEETSERWLDIPHTTFISLALGLEKNAVTVGNWRVLGERLDLTFANIQKLEGLTRSHSNLRPLEVVLLHWSRTQSPMPFTLSNFHQLLIDIERPDLAELIEDIKRKEQEK